MTGVELTLFVGSIANVMATAFAAYAAWRSASAADKSAVVAKEQVLVAVMQKQLAQRQFVIQLWDKMSTLRPVDPSNPVPADVHAAVNTLELVGLCCEGGMIDVDVVKRTFKDRYIELYDLVKECGPIAQMQNKRGVELLRDNPAAMSFYDELMVEKKSSGQLTRT